MSQNSRPKKYSVALFTFAFCLFTYLSCERDFSSLKIYPFSLTAEYVGVTEVRLRLSVKNLNEPLKFTLSRNNSIIHSGFLQTADTVLKDTSLQPAHTYRYRVKLLQGDNNVMSANVQVTTLNITSHNYVWEIDTIGTFGSYLLDVFAITEDDVWAVGEINNGQNDPYNAVHWEGQQWELKRIPFIGPCSAVDYPPIRAIWSFSANHIFFTNGGAIAVHDGSTTFLDCGMNSLLGGAINKIFATHPSNVYAVGGVGSIVYYNGSSWQKMESGTQLRLTDIWGLDKNDIYAVGADMSTLDNVVLDYDGTSWKSLPTDQNRKVGVWGTSPYNLYFAGDGVYRYTDGT